MEMLARSDTDTRPSYAPIFNYYIKDAEEGRMLEIMTNGIIITGLINVTNSYVNIKTLTAMRRPLTNICIDRSGYTGSATLEIDGPVFRILKYIKVVEITVFEDHNLQSIRDRFRVIFVL